MTVFSFLVCPFSLVPKISAELSSISWSFLVVFEAQLLSLWPEHQALHELLSKNITASSRLLLSSPLPTDAIGLQRLLACLWPNEPRKSSVAAIEESLTASDDPLECYGFLAKHAVMEVNQANLPLYDEHHYLIPTGFKQIGRAHV